MKKAVVGYKIDRRDVKKECINAYTWDLELDGMRFYSQLRLT